MSVGLFNADNGVKPPSLGKVDFPLPAQRLSGAHTAIRLGSLTLAALPPPMCRWICAIVAMKLAAPRHHPPHLYCPRCHAHAEAPLRRLATPSGDLKSRATFQASACANLRVSVRGGGRIVVDVQPSV